MTTITAERLAEEHAKDAVPADVDHTVQPPAPIDVDALIRELDAAYNRLPEETLRACQANRELVIPRLIEVLQHAVRVGQDGAVRIGNAPIFALFLLAEFEANEAHPIVMDFLKLPHDIPEELLGESITEDLPRLLAIFACNRIDLLDELIRDQNVNQYVRWAAVNALAFFVRDGRMTRQEAIERLTGHLSHAIQECDASITAPLIDNLVDLNANDSRPEIQRAFDKDLVDELVIDMDCVDEVLRPDQPDTCNALGCRTPTKISDTVAEIRDWNWSGDDDARDEEDYSQAIWPFDGTIPQSSEPSSLYDHDLPPLYEPSTIRHDAPRVGRNDPCPCGSGKKYKKCCLRLNSSTVVGD